MPQQPEENEVERLENVSGEADDKDRADAAASAASLREKEVVSIPDVCEFYIDHTNITDDVMPPAPDSFYSHYVAEDGKVYVDICIAYKNLSTGDRSADEIINGVLVYSGKYEYRGFSIIEENNRGDFTYSNITSIAPLTTEYLHYLFEIPVEAAEDNGSLVILLDIEGNSYSVTVREGTESQAASENKDAAAKKGGEVKDGETVLIEDKCEFFVDYSNITDDVMPLYPDSFYSHYEAEDGKIYVDICIGYKNLKNNDVGADDIISASLTYAGKYEYRGFSMIEENNRGDFTYSNITSIAPLATEYVHYLFEVPMEVGSSAEPIEIEFSIEGNKYFYTVR